MSKRRAGRWLVPAALTATLAVLFGSYVAVRAATSGSPLAMTRATNLPSLTRQAAWPPGTALSDGFVVPEGSHLVGDSFPTHRVAYAGGGSYTVEGNSNYQVPESPGAELAETGFVAVLLADDGDVVPIFAALVDQAHVLKLDLRTRAGQSPCLAYPDPDKDDQGLPLAELKQDMTIAMLTCTALYSRTLFTPDSALVSSTELRVSAFGGTDAADRSTQAHVVIELTKDGDGDGQPQEADLADVTPEELPTPGPHISLVPTQLPGPGESLTPSAEGGTDIGLVVPPGAKAAMAASLTPCPVGWNQILTTDDGSATFHDIVKQLGDTEFVDGIQPADSEALDDRTDLAFSAYSFGGGGSVDVWAVDRRDPEIPDSVMVSYCGGS